RDAHPPPPRGGEDRRIPHDPRVAPVRRVQDEDPPDHPEAPGAPVRAAGDAGAGASRCAAARAFGRGGFAAVRAVLDFVHSNRQNPVTATRPLLSLGLDLDNLWAYMN